MKPLRMVLTLAGDEAALVRDGGSATLASCATRRPRDVPWSTFLYEILSSIPAVERRRARVLAVVDAPRCRFRPLFDVAASTPRASVDTLLTASPEAFFLGEPEASTYGAVTLREDGWWGVALDRSTQLALSAAATASGVVLVGVVPAESLPTSDHSTQYSLLLHERRDPSVVVFDPNEAQRSRRDTRNRRLTLLVCLVLAAIGAVWAPSVSLRLESAALEGRLNGLRKTPAASQGARDLDEMARLSSVADALAGGREATSILVSRLASALPASAAITSLRIDSTSAVLSVVAQPREDVAAALATVPGFAPPVLVGALTREVFDGSDLQRTTVSLALLRPAATGSVARAHR